MHLTIGILLIIAVIIAILCVSSLEHKKVGEQATTDRLKAGFRQVPIEMKGYDDCSHGYVRPGTSYTYDQLVWRHVDEIKATADEGVSP